MSTTGGEPAWTPDALESPHGTADKAHRVRCMFDAIAPTYERVNRLCSAGRDASWRRRAVQLARVKPSDRVLDVACGTGDFARAFLSGKASAVVGCDFSWEMLDRAASRPAERLYWCKADALALPFQDRSFDIVSCAFGVRNFGDLDRGLREMFRILRPGGRAVILEFTRPAFRPFRWVYELYANRIMPAVATWLSGDHDGAYRYLPRSIQTFLSAREMTERLQRVGFSHVSSNPLTMGVVTVYVAEKSQDADNAPHRCEP